MICEDDVELPPNYDRVMETIHAQSRPLKANGIFSWASLRTCMQMPWCQMFKRDGLTFITLDKMTSTVFNIYSRKAMELISAWDETLEDDQINTIDRYLERTSNLRIVTLLEPVFGHRAIGLLVVGIWQCSTPLTLTRARAAPKSRRLPAKANTGLIWLRLHSPVDLLTSKSPAATWRMKSGCNTCSEFPSRSTTPLP